MLKLNILSPELKNDIKLKNIYAILKKSLFFIFLSTTIYAVVLVVSNFYLKNHYSIISLEYNQIKEKNNDIDNEIIQINKQIDQIQKIQESKVNWLKLIEHISKNSSNDIKYNRIAMSKSSGLILVGNSRTRESLLQLKNYLESTSFLTEINFPIQNLLEKENINFEIKAKLSNYEFITE